MVTETLSTPPSAGALDADRETGHARRRSVAAATWSLFLGLGLVMIGNGLNGSVLGVRASAEGFGLGVTGLVMASYFAGFLGGTRYAEHALGTVGHIRVFAALASGAATVVLVQALSVEPLTWAAMRFLFGACMAGIYVTVESWLNDLATNQTRGRILSVYMLVTMGGLGAGQLMLNIEDDSGFRLFILASVLVSLSVVPVSLSANSAPPLTVPQPIRFSALLRRVPTGVISSFLSGAAAGALIGIAAVYASEVGMSQARISLFLFAPMVGALLFQWPIGWASDHFPRRGVIFVVAVGGALAPLLALAVSSRSLVAVLAMFLLGGMMFPLYSLTLAYTNDWLEPGEILAASATLIRVNGTGAVFGPIVAAALMAAFDPRLFFWTLVGIFGAIALHVLYRIMAKDPLPFDRQHHYPPFPARATSGAVRLLLRRTAPDGSQARTEEPAADPVPADPADHYDGV